MKKSTTATETTAKTATAKTANATKTDTIISLDEVYALFVKSVNGKPCKLNYSNAKSQPYCGFDDFSVNMKKSSYNVYMSTANSEICKSIDNTLEIEVNASDTTKKQLRCQLIRFTSTAILKKCINAIATARFATES